MNQKARRVFTKRPEKAGGFVTLLDQRALIDAVLDVANLPQPVSDPEQIYRRLVPFAVNGVARIEETGAEAAAILNLDLLGCSSDKHRGIWRVGVIKVLNAIAGSVSHARQNYGADIDSALSQSKAKLVAVPSFIDGRLGAPLRVDGFGCQAIYATVIAMLLDETLLVDKNRTYGQALRHCEFPQCQKLFLSYTTPEGGAPRKYHDAAPDHQSECKKKHTKIERAQRK